MSGIQPPSPYQAKRVALCHLPMVVRHLGHGHHRSLRTRKRADQVPPSWNRLLYKMDRGWATRIHLDQECSKCRVEKHCVWIRRSEHNNNWQWSTIHWPRSPVFLRRPRHQVNHDLGRAPTNQWAGRGHKQGHIERAEETPGQGKRLMDRGADRNTLGVQVHP